MIFSAVACHKQEQDHHQQIGRIKVLGQKIAQKTADPTLIVFRARLRMGRPGLLPGRRTTALPGTASLILVSRLLLTGWRRLFLYRRTWWGRRGRGIRFLVGCGTAAVRHLAPPEAAVGLGDVSVIHVLSPSCQKLQTSGIKKCGGKLCHFSGPHGLFQLGYPVSAQIGSQSPQEGLLLLINTALPCKTG